MNTNDESVLQFLNSELAVRSAKNPKYSLRAFSKAFDISPTIMSLVLNRKRRPSKTFLEKVEAVALTNELLRSKYQLAKSTSSHGRSTKLESEMDLETFAKISTWLAYAIMTLTEIKGFKEEISWIAKRLRVSTAEVRSAVDALVSAGKLEKGKSWKVVAGDTRINNKVSSNITRTFQRQLIEKAQNSLENDPIEVRDVSSMTFSFPPTQIEEAKKALRDFRLAFAARFENFEEKSEVYNLTVQFIPVSKRKANL